MKAFKAYSVINLVKVFLLLMIFYKAANFYAFEYQTYPYSFLPEVVYTEQLLEVGFAKTGKAYSVGNHYLNKTIRGKKLPAFSKLFDQRIYAQLVKSHLHQAQPLIKAAETNTFLHRAIKFNIPHLNSDNGDIPGFGSEVV